MYMQILYWSFKCKAVGQGCALAEPGGHWPQTFASGQLQNLRFFIEIQCWEPWILQVQSPGPPSMFCTAQP